MDDEILSDTIGDRNSAAFAFVVSQKETIGVDPSVVLGFPELVEAPVPQLQRKISQLISEYQTAEFLESLSVRARACIRPQIGGSVLCVAHIVRERQSDDILRTVSDCPPLAPRPLPQPILKGVHRCCEPGHPPVDPEGVHFVNRNCGSANSARHTAMKGVENRPP
eukprot:528741-Prorocentrum_minimum.AAC.1